MRQRSGIRNGAFQIAHKANEPQGRQGGEQAAIPDDDTRRRDDAREQHQTRKQPPASPCDRRRQGRGRRRVHTVSRVPRTGSPS